MGETCLSDIIQYCLVVLDSFWPMMNCVGCGSDQIYPTAIKHGATKWCYADCVSRWSYFDRASENIGWCGIKGLNRVKVHPTWSSTIQQVWSLCLNACGV